MTQIEFYLPPPITAADAAAMLGMDRGYANSLFARIRKELGAQAR